MNKIDMQEFQKLIESIPEYVPETPLNQFREHASRLFSLDTQTPHGIILVSRCEDIYSIDLFNTYLSGMLWIEILPDYEYQQRFDIQPLAGVLSLQEFTKLRTDVRLPIYVNIN